MAKLADSTSIIFGGAAAAVLATLGMLLCLTVALLGIKFWWFKHRLTFDHSNTSNGAAGGARPAVQMRSRSAKEKRLSQQFREPVDVHGIFRKRQEDELDIVPTAHLPPVRVRKISQSTPSLWLPKKKQQDTTTQWSAFENLEPPTREPPKPPMSPSESLPSLPTPSMDFDQASIFADFEEQFQKMEINRMRPLSMDAALLTPPNPPKRYNRNSSNEIKESGHKFLKARSVSEPEGKKVSERRPTGYVRPSAEDLQMLGEDEDRKTGYIKYEEIDNDGLADFHEKWNNLKQNMAENDPAYSFESYASERKSYQAVVDQHFNHFGTFRTEKSPMAAAPSSDVAPTWPTAQTQITAKVQNIEADSRGMQSHNDSTPLSQNSVEYASEGDETDTQLLHSILISKDSGTYEHYVDDYDWKEEREIVAQRNVKLAMEPLGEDEEKEPTLKMRRPTGYIRNDRQLWEDLEASIGPNDTETKLWLEMERDVNQDFAANIDDEFNKIRHSYEENEGDFLETKYLQAGYNDEDAVIAVKPQGFGKSIDEDWENFERLADAKEPPSYKDIVSELSLTDDEDYKDSSAVTFNVPHSDYTDDKESTLRTARRPTGYVRNIEEIHDELDLSDNTGLREFEYIASVQYENAELTARKSEHTSILKERGPTAYVRPSEESLLPDDEVGDGHKNEIFEPLEERKPNRRPKVTFDFNTTEHSYQPQASEATLADSEMEPAESDDDAYSSSSSEVPKPMQRSTKSRYTNDYSNMESSSPSPSPPALLFGTHISLETDMNDSWSAIRQRRFQHEELRLPSPERCGAAYEPPKPAYRNPLAQVTVSSRVQTEERLVPAPRTMREETKPQPQSRHYFGETYGTSTTEA